MKPITKVYEIWTKYGNNYVWKHNGEKWKVEEKDGFITYIKNNSIQGCLMVDDITDYYVNTGYEVLSQYNNFYGCAKNE